MSGRKRTGNHSDEEAAQDTADFTSLPVRKKQKEGAPVHSPPVDSNDDKALSEHQSAASETSYYYSNGLRRVVPYYFTFSTHAKGRWVGRRVHDIFSEEFQSQSPQYYERAIKLGKVTVNGQVATMETVVKDNQVVTHCVHRHEPPVTASPLRLLHNDQHLVVVDKPASIPVHPCGRYRHNTVILILANEYNMKNLHTLHRLDRLTSGLLIFGKTLSKVQEMERQIRERKVKKEYLALVKGHFPEETIECCQPIRVESHKVGVCRVDPTGKPCSTTFTLISCRRDTSLVKCQPKTGRMHQIRVHLQWLGYPIVNDPLYNHPAWGPERGKEGRIEKDIKSILSDLIESKFGASSTEEQSLSLDRERSTEPFPEESKSQEEVETGSEYSTGSLRKDKEEQPTTVLITDSSSTVDPHCTECHTHYPDPAPHELYMCLHALRYEGEGWEFETDPPEWARDYLDEDGGHLKKRETVRCENK